jgi:hypothetical protein
MDPCLGIRLTVELVNLGQAMLQLGILTGDSWIAAETIAENA